MSETRFEPSPEIVAKAHIDAGRYAEMYGHSVDDPVSFWGEHGKRVDWIQPYSRVKEVSYGWPEVSIRWYDDGILNVCANCVDRHLPARSGQTAIIWEGDTPGTERHISYRELHEQVCRLANVYKSLGVRKGDRIVLYMPMIPEAAYAMLASARIGAVHSVVFGGFSPEALASRIQDCGASLVGRDDE
ncbi:MAG: AMP-binding protein, partial [Rhodobacteraceae bacterium]|nr:AMP-binding protein [Paracoccaceae bacterium]